MNEVSYDIPNSRSELLSLIRNMPLSILSRRERDLIDGILNLDDSHISDIMIPAEKITYVHLDDVLGPITLSRLYESGLEHFPVKNNKDEIVGSVTTSKLNALEATSKTTVREFLDPNIYYAREDYTYSQTLDAFLRTKTYLLLVVNNFGKLVGLLDFQKFCDEIFGKTEFGDFNRDNDAPAVAKRNFPIEIGAKH